jgi:hypothetical protein
MAVPFHRFQGESGLSTLRVRLCLAWCGHSTPQGTMDGTASPAHMLRLPSSLAMMGASACARAMLFRPWSPGVYCVHTMLGKAVRARWTNLTPLGTCETAPPSSGCWFVQNPQLFLQSACLKGRFCCLGHRTWYFFSFQRKPNTTIHKPNDIVRYIGTTRCT